MWKSPATVGGSFSAKDLGEDAPEGCETLAGDFHSNTSNRDVPRRREIHVGNDVFPIALLTTDWAEGDLLCLRKSATNTEFWRDQRPAREAVDHCPVEPCRPEGQKSSESNPNLSSARSRMVEKGHPLRNLFLRQNRKDQDI